MQGQKTYANDVPLTLSAKEKEKFSQVVHEASYLHRYEHVSSDGKNNQLFTCIHSGLPSLLMASAVCRRCSI